MRSMYCFSGWLVLFSLSLVWGQQRFERVEARDYPTVEEMLHGLDDVSFAPLNADAFEGDALVFSIQNTRLWQEGLLENVSTVLSQPECMEVLEEFDLRVVSPGWQNLLSRRAIFSADVAQTGVAAGSADFLLFSEQAEVIGFQVPGTEDYSSELFLDFARDILERYENNAASEAFASMIARTRKFEQWQGGDNQLGLMSSYPDLAGLVLAQLPTSSGDESLYYVHVALLLLEGDVLPEGVNRRLVAAAVRSAQQLLEGFEDEELFLLTQRGDDKLTQATLVTQLRLISSLQMLQSYEPSLAQELDLAALWIRYVEAFTMPEFGVVEQLTVDAQGQHHKRPWVSLETLGVVALTALDFGHEDVVLDWLAQLADRAQFGGEQVAALPESVFPFLGGEPISIAGVSMIGEACLRASELEGQDSQRWMQRSTRLMDALLELARVPRERGLVELPLSHPLSVPAEAIYQARAAQTTMQALGSWLLALREAGHEPAGQAMRWLLADYRLWAQMQELGAQNQFIVDTIVWR